MHQLEFEAGCAGLIRLGDFVALAVFLKHMDVPLGASCEQVVMCTSGSESVHEVVSVAEPQDSPPVVHAGLTKNQKRRMAKKKKRQLSVKITDDKRKDDVEFRKMRLETLRRRLALEEERTRSIVERNQAIVAQAEAVAGGSLVRTWREKGMTVTVKSNCSEDEVRSKLSSLGPSDSVSASSSVKSAKLKAKAKVIVRPYGQYRHVTQEELAHDKALSDMRYDFFDQDSGAGARLRDMAERYNLDINNCHKPYFGIDAFPFENTLQNYYPGLFSRRDWTEHYRKCTT